MRANTADDDVTKFRYLACIFHPGMRWDEELVFVRWVEGIKRPIDQRLCLIVACVTRGNGVTVVMLRKR